jgi:hypothetical protein
MSTGLDSIASVYSEARAEYSKQLCVFLVPAYFKFFIDLLEKARQSMVAEPKKSLWQFQNYLNEIHDWNMEKVNSEIHNIYTNCGCDYLDDLITMVFIAHTKVLTAIRLSSNNKKVEINVPRVEHFLFKALCETAKMLWGSTYLFRDGISGIEKQQNYRQIENIINEGILQAVRSLLPVKSIIKDYVKSQGGSSTNDDSESDSDSDSSSDDDKEPVKAAPTIEPSVESLSLTPAIEKDSEIKIPDEIPLVSADSDLTSSDSASNVPPITESIPTTPKNEVIIPPLDTPQTIIIDEKPNVRFGEFDAVFDSDNPLDSDMIFEPKDGDEDSVPDLEILDEIGQPLAMDDFEDLDRKEEAPQELGDGDYEPL